MYGQMALWQIQGERQRDRMHRFLEEPAAFVPQTVPDVFRIGAHEPCRPILELKTLCMDSKTQRMRQGRPRLLRTGKQVSTVVENDPKYLLLHRSAHCGYLAGISKGVKHFLSRLDVTQWDPPFGNWDQRGTGERHAACGRGVSSFICVELADLGSDFWVVHCGGISPLVKYMGMCKRRR